MTELVFPGQFDPTARGGAGPGGCELGLGRCVRPAEVEVTVPETRHVRRLCREHVGYAMLGAVGEARRATVLVRRLQDDERADLAS